MFVLVNFILVKSFFAFVVIEMQALTEKKYVNGEKICKIFNVKKLTTHESMT